MVGSPTLLECQPFLPKLWKPTLAGSASPGNLLEKQNTTQTYWIKICILTRSGSVGIENKLGHHRRQGSEWQGLIRKDLTKEFGESFKHAWRITVLKNPPVICITPWKRWLKHYFGSESAYAHRHARRLLSRRGLGPFSFSLLPHSLHLPIHLLQLPLLQPNQLYRILNSQTWQSRFHLFDIS